MGFFQINLLCFISSIGSILVLVIGGLLRIKLFDNMLILFSWKYFIILSKISYKVHKVTNATIIDKKTLKKWNKN